MNVSISELKNNLSAILAMLKSKGEIVIFDRKVAVGIIRPYSASAGSSKDERVFSLERAGVISVANSSWTDIEVKKFAEDIPKPKNKKSALKYLLEDRELSK